MSNSRTPCSQGKHSAQVQGNPTSPGSSGKNDHAKSSRACLPGNTPGSVGRKDLAEAQIMCSHTKKSTSISKSTDQEFYVFSVEKLFEWAKFPGEYGVGIGSLIDADNLATLFRDFGITGLANDLKKGNVNYYIKTYRGKEYVIIKGYAGLRSYFTGTKYLAQHSKVLSLSIGKASAIKNGAKSGIWSFVFVAAIEISEYLLTDKETLADLGVDLFSELAKAAIATSAAVIVSTAVASALTGAVLVPVAVGLGVGLIVAYGLNVIDNKLGITKSLKKWANVEWAKMQRDWENTKYKTRRWWHFLNTTEGALWFMKMFSR